MMEHRSRIIQYFVAASVSLASLTLGVSTSWATPVMAKFNNANETDITMTEQEQSWMLAMNNPGFIIGSFVTRFTSDRFGRRFTILASALPMALGTIVLLWAHTAWEIYITRFLWGGGTAMIGIVVSMYLAEIADKDLRGTLSVGTRFMFNLGALMAISLGPFLSYRALNSSLVILPLCYFIACWWIPESPYYYLKEGRMVEAGKTLSKLRCYREKKEVENELLTLQSAVNSEMRRGSSVRELFGGPQYRKAIIIAAGLKLTQIMAGVTTVQNYLGPIMTDSKWNMKQSTILLIFGVVRFITGMMSSALADRVGRRPLLIYSFLGTGLCHILAGTFFFAQDVFKVDNSSLVQFAWVPFAGIVGSSFISTLGFASIIFVIPAELFPINIKAVALSCLSVFGGILGFGVAKGFKELKDLIGLSGVFWFYASIALCGAVFSYFCVPETKGKSLKEIQILLKNDMYGEDDGKLDDVTLDNKDDNTELQDLNKKVVTRL